MTGSLARLAAAILSVSALCVSMSGCGSTTGSASAPIAGTEWRPLYVADSVPDISEEARVRFEADGKLSGNGGCNGFFGTYEITGDRVMVGPIGATRRACPDPIGQNEFALLQALEKARRFGQTEDGLTLFDDAGTPLVRLKQADAR